MQKFTLLKQKKQEELQKFILDPLLQQHSATLIHWCFWSRSSTPLQLDFFQHFSVPPFVPSQSSPLLAFSSDCNWTRTQNHLVHKRTLNHLAKCLSVPLRTKWFWVRVQLQSLKLQILRLIQARRSLIFRQLYYVESLCNAYVTWQEHTVSCFFNFFISYYWDYWLVWWNCFCCCHVIIKTHKVIW